MTTAFPRESHAGDVTVGSARLAGEQGEHLDAGRRHEEAVLELGRGRIRRRVGVVHAIRPTRPSSHAPSLIIGSIVNVLSGSITVSDAGREVRTDGEV